MIAIIGTGAIGTSWAALFLRHGHPVVASDPAPGAQERLRAGIAAIGVPDDAELRFTTDAGDAAAGATFVQENGPERLDVKHALIAQLDGAAAPGVVIASSSSGLLPTEIARGATRHPERVLVGHPFHPPHLVPLVEVVPGERTSEAAVEAALATYRDAGRRPIRLRAELPGHVANRLQAALWQEAYSLVERGVATVADIDAAIANGPGLRWALLGPFANQHLGGGPGGIAHILDHLGPPTEAWWRDLRAVTLSPELNARIVAGMDDELALTGTDTAGLGARRDAALAALLQLKKENDL
jgi:carnitine 3-dehydrogenase